MTTYYVTIFAVFVLSCVAVQTNKSNQNSSKKNTARLILLFTIGTILIFVSGFRYYVGTDYSAYYNGFKTYALMLWPAIKELNEPGLPILASVLGLVTNNGIWFIFTCSAITVGLVVFTTYKNVDTFVFSTMLIIFTGIWHGSFNGVRQYVAAAIIFAGYRYIYEKKFWKYAIVVFTAYLFHSSALFMILPYFILRNKISLKNVVLLTIGTLIFLLNYDRVFSFIGFMKESEFDATYGYTLHHVNRLRVLAGVAPALVCLFLYSRSKKTRDTTFYINALILNAVVSIATMNSALLTRFNIYTSMFLPIALGRLIVQKNKRVELALKCIIVLLYSYFWYYEISNSSDLSNFEFIFSR